MGRKEEDHANRTFGRITALTILAALAVPIWTAAQDSPSPDNKPKHHQYKVIDIGTFGGPNSFVPTSFLTEVGAQVISDQGTVAGAGDLCGRPALLLRRLLLP